MAEQGGKISRADKSLRKAQKDIQNLYVLKGDDTVLLQQVDGKFARSINCTL